MIEAPYALLDGSVIPDGVVVERDETVGTALWRLTGPLSSREEITGIYPDTWSGPRVRWSLLRCEGGRITATVHSDPSLFTQAQRLRASNRVDGAGVDAIARVPPTGERVSLSHPGRAVGRDVHRRLRRLADREPVRGHPGLDGRPRAWRPLRRLRLRAGPMRIVVDVSPLSHPRTGIGNYIRGSLAGLAEAAAGRHELVAFGPTSLKGPDAIRAAIEGIPVSEKLIRLPASHALRTAWSRLGHPPVERLVGPLDAFVFSDWMYPPSAAAFARP